MTDQDVTIVTPVAPEQSDNADTHMIPRKRLNEVLEREREKDKQLKELLDKQTALEQAEALKRGDHEKIIAELRPQAERLAVVEAVISEMLAAELAALPEAMAGQAQDILALIPTSEGKLKAVRGLQAMQPTTPTKPVPPPLNGGAGGPSPSGTGNPTPEDVEWAAASGLTIDKYMQYKNRKD